jgi:hypothetical protein
MTLPTVAWIRRLSSSEPGRLTSVPRRRHKFRPGLDLMECRLMLSTLNAFHSVSAARLASPSFHATATTTQVRLSWNAVRHAKHYSVEEYTASGWSVLTNTKSTSFVVSGLQPGVSYRFDVGARNASRMAWGQPQQVTTVPPAPAAPTISASPVSSSQVELSWNVVPYATSYTVAEYTASGWSVLGNTNSTSFIASGLQPGASYEFDVAAGNASGMAWGQPQQVTTPIPTIPPPTQASETSTTTTTQSGLGLVNTYPSVTFETGWYTLSPLQRWISARLGQKVGNGQCADLVNYALINNGYKTFYQTGGPTGADADYVWGKLVATITPANCKSMESLFNNSTAPNNDLILQFRNVTITHTDTNPDGSYTSSTITAPHHTAYVEGGGDIYYSNGSHDWSLDVLEQNANNVEVVTHDSLYLPDMTGGTIYVYAPIPI